MIAATNRDLETEVAAGRFRADLFYRLNVVSVRLPSLRERREDMSRLIEHLLGVLAARYGRHGLRVSEAARTTLLAYDCPGNVRELLNTLERATVLARGDEIAVTDLPDGLVAPARTPPSAPTEQSLEEIERQHIVQVLGESATLEDAAARLGINVTTLWRKRKRFGID